MKKITIIQPVMKGYRLPFFSLLNDHLAKRDISLKVVYSSPWSVEAKRKDGVDLPCTYGRKVKSYMIFGKYYLQLSVGAWLTSDLIIVEQANKHILNILFIILRSCHVKKIAYWGHGRSRQSKPDTLSEKFKKHSLHWVDWWFAYTKGVTSYLKKEGFVEDRITTVENTIDTVALRKELSNVITNDRLQQIHTMGWNSDSRITIFCGSLYHNKKIDWLLTSAQVVHQSYSKFRLIIIGGGALESKVQDFCNGHTWAFYAGPKFGHEKSVLLSLSEIWLNPGLVGLGILDAFCAGLPLVTTDLRIHSPEIDYLEHGQNGLLLEPSCAAFTNGVLALLEDKSLLTKLQKGAMASGKKYSIETMVNNFTEGVVRCLSQ